MFSTASKFAKFAFSALYVVYATGYFLDRNAPCVYCTEKAVAFLDSPYPQLPFDINIALVQRRYHCLRQVRIIPNFHSRTYTRCIKPGYLPSRDAQCVYCNEKAIAFLSSPYPQLPFDANIAWCKSGNIVFDSFEVCQISILGHLRGA